MYVCVSGFGVLLAAIQLALLFIFKKGKVDSSSIAPDNFSDIPPPEYLHQLLYRVNFVEDADSYLHSFHFNASKNDQRKKVNILT